MPNLDTCSNCTGRVTHFWMHRDQVACSRQCRDELARKDINGPVFMAPPSMDLRAHLLKQHDFGDACTADHADEDTDSAHFEPGASDAVDPTSKVVPRKQATSEDIQTPC